MKKIIFASLLLGSAALVQAAPAQASTSEFAAQAARWASEFHGIQNRSEAIWPVERAAPFH